MEDQAKVNKALSIVKEYLRGKTEAEPTLFVVWQAAVLQNFKCIIATTLPCWTHFVLTYDGENGCWYFDVFTKTDNMVIPDD